MNPLTTARKNLAAALTTSSVPTYPELPEKARPPFCYVLRSETNQVAKTLGEWQVGLRVICVVKNAANVVMADAADDMALAVLAAVRELDGFTIGSPAIGETSRYEYNAQPTMAVAVTVNARVSRAQMEG